MCTQIQAATRTAGDASGSAGDRTAVSQACHASVCTRQEPSVCLCHQHPTPTPTPSNRCAARIGDAAMAMTSGGGLDGGGLEERNRGSIVEHRRCDRPASVPAQPLSASSCPDPASDLSTMVERCYRASSIFTATSTGGQGAGRGNGMAIVSSVAHRYRLSIPTQHSDFQQPSSRRRVQRRPHVPIAGTAH
jgi:hypothetical protein